MLMLNDFAKEVHANACEKGWWDEPRSFGEIIALCHSELSEALEEYRDKKPMLYYLCDGHVCDGDDCDDCETRNERIDKPEGIAVEMADCVIRILDWCGKEDMAVEEAIKNSKPLQDYMEELPEYRRESGFGGLVSELHLCLSMAYRNHMNRSWNYLKADWMAMCIKKIYEWAETELIDMEAILRLKHEYNLTRPYKHGGKVI